MAKSRRKEELPGKELAGGLTHNPFAALRPDGAPAPKAEEPTGEEAPVEPGGRVVVRREKKGRAGKTVTRVEGLELEADALAELARALKRALGCGASLEESDVLVQGDHTKRVAEWLRTERGRRVVVGN